MFSGTTGSVEGRWWFVTDLLLELVFIPTVFVSHLSTSLLKYTKHFGF